MMCDDGRDVRLIDFEGAYEQDIDVPATLYTPGFAPQEVVDEGMATPDDDLYALGGLMLAALCPINSLMSLDPTSASRFVGAVHRDLGLPQPVVDVIFGLLSLDRKARPRPEQVIRVLREQYEIPAPDIGTYEADSIDLDELVRQLVRYIVASADPSRGDRLFPADPVVFETNPMSIGYGACGVAHALRHITGEVPGEIRDWIIRQPLSNEAYPPGLYVGLSGIAWVLLEMGCEEQAYKALELARTNPLLRKETDIFYGVAGWGLTELRFYLHTGDARHLARAEEAARFVIEARQDMDDGCFWRSQGSISTSFAHGASGIAAFLIYLHLATGNAEYLDNAGKALAYVASKAIPIVDDGVSWRATEDRPTYTPYWRWGSAGVGMALLRYMEVVPDAPYRPLFEKLIVDCDRKYSIFPGRFFGLSGVGDFCLDWARFGPDRELAMRAARKTLSGALLFKVDRKNGAAFPGDTLSRVSCDYGTGSAGIALFIHRLRHGGETDFMLDQLLGRRSVVAAPADDVAVAVG
jgi:hypothetical protein